MIKEIIIIICLNACLQHIMSITEQYADIRESQPQIIFRPLGKLLTQFSYANIKIHVNTTELYKEVDTLCKVSKMLIQKTEQVKGLNQNDDKYIVSKRMIKTLAQDIQADCIHSTRKLHAISKTFGFDPHTTFKHIPSLESNGKEIVSREKRQIIALATIAAISFISIFSTSQLMSMVSSGDDDLITNQNHIITAIQDQENQLRRNKDNILRLTNHVNSLKVICI